jgi:hypothetical protein
VSSGFVEATLRPPPALRQWLGSLALRRARLPYHTPGLVPALGIALWLTRHWLFSSSLPAGTDMLGFVSRAQQNRSLGQALSLWNPAGWGARRALTMESLLGLLTSFTGDPVLTVKLAALAILLASGIFAYLLAWRIRPSRLGAATAGVLYMTSQQSLSHWTSGHVNVEVGIALTPLILLLWIEGVRAFSVARSCGLAVAAAAIVLARPDLLLYPLPFMVLYVFVRLAVVPGVRATLRNAALTSVSAAAATLLLSSYLIVPTLAGIRARWLTVESLFGLKQLAERSLSAYPSLLGFAREIGYLAFTGQQTWSSHPWLPFPLYAASASIIVLLAFAAPAFQRDDRLIYLACTAVLATLLGKGPHGPVGHPYLWLVSHVPILANLRDPNRWLIVQAVAYAVLAGVTVSWIANRLRPRALSLVATGALGSAALLPVAPTLSTGLRSITVSAAQRQLLARVAADPHQSLVASVPYDQTYRFIQQRGYRGWEHDLGSESAAFTNHAAVGDGGWNQQAADTVAFTSTLLRHRDPATVTLLGTLGVKYLLDFSYPASDPHLLTGGAGPFTQQRALAALPGLEPLEANRAGTLYQLSAFSPLVSLRPSIAVVLGGREGIAAFADLPSVDLRSWSVFTADDLLAEVGVDGLLSLARRADALVVADTTPNDLAVLASPPLASLPGITSDPGLDTKTQIVPSDASTRLGSLASQTASAAQSLRRSGATSFIVRQRQTLELWARVRSSSSAARLSFGIDGTRVRTLLPLTVVGGGFRWYLVARRTFAPGWHRLNVTVHNSAFGGSYELDQAKLIDATTRASLRSRFASLLDSRAERAIFADTPAQIQTPLSAGELESQALDVAPDPNTFWRVLEPDHVRATAQGGLLLALSPTRHLHTIVEHHFARALDWSGANHLLLRFRGTGTGATYRFVVDFNRVHHRSASLFFTDRRSGWQTASFAGVGIGSTAPERWSHVTAIRLATDDRTTSGLLEIGALRIATAPPRTIRLPVAPLPRTQVVNVAGKRLVVPPDATHLTVKLSPRQLLSGGRVVIGGALLRSGAPGQVHFARTGATSYRFTVASRRPGVLQFAQAYDPRWQVTIDGRSLKPTSGFGLVNTYLVPAGHYTGTIRFAGNGFEVLGAAISAGSLLLLAGVALLDRRRGQRKAER